LLNNPPNRLISHIHLSKENQPLTVPAAKGLASLGDKLFFGAAETPNTLYILVTKELTSIRVQKPVLSEVEGLALFFQPRIPMA
jgi:hypothetical protein